MIPRPPKSIGKSGWIAHGITRDPGEPGLPGPLSIVWCHDPDQKRDMLTPRTLRRSPRRGEKRNCAGCKGDFTIGTTMFGPLGNGAHRADRFCVSCIEYATL